MLDEEDDWVDDEQARLPAQLFVVLHLMIDRFRKEEDVHHESTMKALAIITIAFVTAATMVGAQTPPANSDLTQPVTPQTIQMVAQSVVFQTEMVQKVFGLDITLGGPLPKAIKEGKPWQLINPWAPSDYGDGFGNVSIDPETGRADGIKVLDIRF